MSEAVKIMNVWMDAVAEHGFVKAARLIEDRVSTGRVIKAHYSTEEGRKSMVRAKSRSLLPPNTVH